VLSPSTYKCLGSGAHLSDPLCNSLYINTQPSYCSSRFPQSDAQVNAGPSSSLPRLPRATQEGPNSDVVIRTLRTQNHTRNTGASTSVLLCISRALSLSPRCLSNCCCQFVLHLQMRSKKPRRSVFQKRARLSTNVHPGFCH